MDRNELITAARDILVGGAGAGATAVIEYNAETRARRVFGTNTGPGSLSPLEAGARVLLYMAEAAAGLAAAEAADTAGLAWAAPAGDGMAYGAGWHIIRLGYRSLVGTTLLGAPV